MPNEVRSIFYDKDLNIEACTLEGIVQSFPNHFHDYYVIGYIELGKRYLLCKNQEYTLNPSDMNIFNPRDTHSCKQIDGKTLDYRCINIPLDTMKKTMFEITGEEYLPVFSQTLLYKSDLANSLKDLHNMICNNEKDFAKEEIYMFLISQLIQDYSDKSYNFHKSKICEFDLVCRYLEENYAKTITLNDLSEIAGISKYHFLRLFTYKKGISPYSYLETIRIDKARELLKQGVSPIDVAISTGFSDQSHFSKFFKKFIGLTPKQYMRIYTSKI